MVALVSGDWIVEANAFPEKIRLFRSICVGFSLAVCTVAHCTDLERLSLAVNQANCTRIVGGYLELIALL